MLGYRPQGLSQWVALWCWAIASSVYDSLQSNKMFSMLDTKTFFPQYNNKRPIFRQTDSVVLGHRLSFPLSHRYPSCYVGCTETHQDAQRPVSSQDVGSEKEAGEKIHRDKVQSAAYYHSTTNLIAQRFHRLLMKSLLWPHTNFILFHHTGNLPPF